MGYYAKSGSWSNIDEFKHDSSSNKCKTSESIVDRNISELEDEKEFLGGICNYKVPKTFREMFGDSPAKINMF